MILDLCPFKMMALGVRHGGKVYTADGKTMIQQDVDLRCVGEGCMFFMPTSRDEKGVAKGGCSPAIAVVQLHELNNNLAVLMQNAGLTTPKLPWHVRLRAWLRRCWETLAGPKEDPVPAPIPLHPVDEKGEP